MVKEPINYSEYLNVLLKGFQVENEESNIKALDLVVIMGSIYCADIGKHAGSNPRLLSIDIPIHNPSLWYYHKEQVEDLAHWVSGDTYELLFSQNKNAPFKEYTLPINFQLPTTLFSGGLDSLAGAYHNFKCGLESDYIGFINKDEEHTHQKKIGGFYKNVFSSVSKIHLIEKPKIPKTHYTQATRSLLYIALAVANSHFNKSKDVYLYENGILSLNPEISGRFTTKTTHPKTLYKYNLLISSVGFEIKVNHPFMFNTKGQIIHKMNNDFKGKIKQTFTCGAGRSPGNSHKGQCGICVPFILRKVSLASYENEKYDCIYHYSYEIKFSDITNDIHRKDFKSNFQYFIDYVNLIQRGEIYNELDVKKRYYKGIEDYSNKNNEMLQKFSYEFERFLEKYDPN
jgi:hypothetical protein